MFPSKLSEMQKIKLLLALFLVFAIIGASHRIMHIHNENKKYATITH
jgi:hypothetical protein